LALLLQLQTLPWKALEGLKCNISPKNGLKQYYGRWRMPHQLLKVPQPPPCRGTLKEVILHFDGEIYNPPNPMWFVYALLEMLPIDTKISYHVVRAFTFEDPSADGKIVKRDSRPWHL
jgi:hypothetical protein